MELKGMGVPIMIKVFLGLSGLNLKKKCQAGQKQTDLGKAIQRLRGNLPNLATQEGLWGTHNLDGFGRHL